MIPLFLGAVALIFLALVGFVVLSWVVADRVVRPRRLPPTPFRVVDEHLVELRATRLSGFPGPMGFRYDNESRHTPLGAVVLNDKESVAREIEETNSLLLVSGGIGVGRVVGDTFGTPANAGLSVDEVEFEHDGLRLPAWVLGDGSANGQSWAIHVHGAMSDRESMLRTASSFARHGFTSLVVTYRGDAEAPAAHQASTLGQTEWEDLVPAVAYALAKGASRIVLVGMSLGASISLAFVNCSPLGRSIAGIVLVAPVLDWRSSIEAQVQAARLPRVVAMGATRLLTGRLSSHKLGLSVPLRFSELDFAGRMELKIPTLIIHSTADPVAPYKDSQRLAVRFPTLVTLKAFEGDGEHALEWNRDTAGFNEALGTWLKIH